MLERLSGAFGGPGIRIGLWVDGSRSLSVAKLPASSS